MSLVIVVDSISFQLPIAQLPISGLVLDGAQAVFVVELSASAGLLQVLVGQGFGVHAAVLVAVVVQEQADVVELVKDLLVLVGARGGRGSLRSSRVACGRIALVVLVPFLVLEVIQGCAEDVFAL